MKAIKKVSETIIVGKEAYFYLRQISRVQRGCEQFTDEQMEGIWQRVNAHDRIRLSDTSLGGGDGTYDGKWWGWNVDMLKKMLDEAGFIYTEGDPLEYMSL